MRHFVPHHLEGRDIMFQIDAFRSQLSNKIPSAETFAWWYNICRVLTVL
jgi:hypothetical protein